MYVKKQGQLLGDGKWIKGKVKDKKINDGQNWENKRHWITNKILRTTHNEEEYYKPKIKHTFKKLGLHRRKREIIYIYIFLIIINILLKESIKYAIFYTKH